MKTVRFIDLLTIKELNISSFFAMNQYWEQGRAFVMKKPRRQSAFLWFCGTSGTFLCEEGRKTEVPKGALVYIPQGAVYTVTFNDQATAVSTLLIEFCMDDGEPFVLTDSISIVESSLCDRAITDLMYSLVNAYEQPSKPWLKIRRDILTLLYLLASKEEKMSIGHKNFEVIEKGIEYLQKDDKQELTIEEIAKMCFVTSAYFRRLFREYSGMSPSEYRTRMKIERAKCLMTYSNLSVADLSGLLGYNDPSYFCRVFKRETGMSPSDYKKTNKKD